MKTIFALLIKFVVTLAAAWISFSLFSYVAFYTVLIIAITGTVLNYLIGDMLILPRLGNTIATVVDGLLSAVTAYTVLYYSTVTYYTMTSILVFAVIVAVAEIFFHMYLVKSDIVKSRDSELLLRNKKINYNTETGNELYPYSNKTDNNVRISDTKNNDYKNNSL